MNNKYKFILILTLMCFLTINTVFANDINSTVTSSGDLSQELTGITNDTLLQAGKSFSTLDDDLSEGYGSEIDLTSDYVYSFLDFGYANGININRDLTINGNGHTIDGDNQARIFHIADDSLNVIIKDVVFVNGETSKNGGAIAGKCTVINCTFINNTAFNGGALYGASAINCTFKDNTAKADGGAIYIDSPNISIENCTFENNLADQFGGAISINSVLTGTTISNSTFRKNTANKGGALGVFYSQNLSLSNSKFISNEAKLDGGAIHYDFSLQDTIDNCYFENNIADGNGGAFTWILSNGNITNSRFNRNTAKGNGGAIYFNISNTTVLVERQILTDCNFTENTAVNGGALYCDGFYRIIDGTFNFIKNSAKQNGGAVYCGDLSSFSNSLFLNNNAQNGGALHCNNSCSIFGSKFIDNTAKDKGGAIAANNYNFLFDNQFMNNSAKTGGAIYSNNYNTVSKADFINNSAENDGGALYSKDYGLIYNSKFNNNSAYHGGAVLCEAFNEIAYCEFTRNYAYQGPAIYTDDIRNVINNTVFLKNKQEVPEADFKNENYKLTLQLLDDNYLFNAVYSWFPLACLNITYWNGTVTTVSEPDTMGGAGIDFTVEVYDSNNNLIKKEIRKTDNSGKLVYDYFDFDGGNYTFKLIHEDDDYYPEFSKTYETTVGDFAKLQAMLALAKDNGIINLTRNFTYSIGYDTLTHLGVYSENLTIYGNGYTIDALNQNVSFSDQLKNITFLNCTFKNGMDFNLRGEHVLISDCNFENTGLFRGNNANSFQIINCNFDSNMKGSYFSVCELRDNNITIIKNSNFTNNFVSGASGAAINLRNNKYELIIGCNFINNTDGSEAGAIYGNSLTNFNLVNCSFINNSAEIDGGAIVLNPNADAIINIDGCIFLNNTAKERAGAIKSYGDSTIKNSVFLNNKAASGTIEMNVVDVDTIKFSFEGQNDYINAIILYGRPSFDNVTYWDGTVANTNKKSFVKATPGQNITIKAFDKNDKLIFETVEKTDENGQLLYGIHNLPYETKYVVGYHEDDAYYTRSANVTRNVTRMGDFDLLQLLINAAGENGVVNLTRDYTYAEGFETSEYLYLNYNNITINGNGYSINFNKTGFIYINEANGITLNNISFTGGERQDALIYIGGDCEINDCNFTNHSLGSDNVIHQYKINTNLVVKNTNFINITATAIRLDDFTSASIYSSDFLNNTQAISAGGNTFNGLVKSILISECGFTNNSDINNTAALELKANTILIQNSNFTNNKGSDGGAFNFGGNILNITNSTFEGNIANEGGAIYAKTNDVTVNGCDFLNNSANGNGGAVYVANSNKYLNVDNSTFRFNSADIGPAIYSANGTCILNNVTVLDNRAQSVSLLEIEKIENYDLTMKFEGKTNYINGIYSKSIEFHNVIYWNGEVVNSDDVYPVENQYSGHKINLEIYDRNDKLVDNVTLVTDGQNNVYYKFINGENGNYSFKAYHLDDNYYSYIGGCNGTFESIRPESSVNINIVNGAGLYYPNFKISFDITNKTVSRVVITNINGSQVYINQTTDDDYITVDLDPSEDYYNITVYNDYTADYVGSQDSKLFKIMKLNTSVIINPIPDIYYNNIYNVTFESENFETANITVIDVYGNIVFNEISSNKFVTIPMLPVGTYNITITTKGERYYADSSNSTQFNIIPAHNNAKVSVENVVYGNMSVIVVSADIDGIYAVDVNGTIRNVTVVNKTGNCSLSLGAGRYYANVTFANGNYSTNSTTAIFDVYKAMTNVSVSVENVVYGNVSVIVVSTDIDGIYAIDVNGTITTIDVVNNTGNFTLSLGAGSYYANVTFVNGNYSTNSTNVIFDVYKALNNVRVITNNVVYGNPTTVVVYADVDGVYTVDVNGTIRNVTVVNKKGSFDVYLDVGNYYANVSALENNNYTSKISNTAFKVYKAINVVEVTAYSIVYGLESVIKVAADVDGVYTLDINGNVSKINVVNGSYSVSMRLPAGKYYANVTFDDGNYSNIIINATFDVYKSLNNVKVMANSVVYGNPTTIIVSADVDGVYTLDFNGNVTKINVVNGSYSTSLNLTAGKYYANVTFDDGNYSNTITNAVFDVYKAVNRVRVIAYGVTYGQDVLLRVLADADGVYNLDFNGNVTTIEVVNGKYSTTLRLAAGKYYANATFDDSNYSTTVINTTFVVSPAVNNVKVIANSVIYGNDVPLVVAANVDGVYALDINGNVSKINVVNGRYSDSLRLHAGKYYANVTFDNGNYSSVITNAVFEVYKAVNNVVVSVDNVVYGKESVIKVIADVDGVYTVDVNGTVRQVSVVDHVGNFSLYLGVGMYYANVSSLENEDYISNVSNDLFEVYPAANNVKVSSNSVVYGNMSVINVSADVDGVYTLDFNGNVTTINVVNGSYSTYLRLGVGKYYANVTFDNGNYSSVITNAVFEVYPALNKVKVIANSVTYGNQVVIIVSANVDGVYKLDVNGKVSTVNVVNGTGSVSMSLSAGKYYANVTFDNGNYSSVINNAVFEVYKAVNNVKVFANSVSYGNDVVLVVVADVDGGYKLDVNGNISKIKVVNGNYSTSLKLGVGKYYANVTFDNPNYVTTIYNEVFEVYPAVNNVKVIANSVIYGDPSVIVVYADVDGVYTVDVNGTVRDVTVVNHLGNFSLSLDAGRYYANVTFENSNYSSVITNDVFDVYKALNNVQIIVYDDMYSPDLILEVVADVDGEYILDFNGNVSSVSVVNGSYSVILSLAPGMYYANVTFDNDNYVNLISNIEFEVYPPVNFVKVSADSVVYGQDVVVNVTADVDGVYNLDINGNVTTINVVGGRYSTSLRLAAGKYYANVTFDDNDYENIITNAVFEVYKATNNVQVSANSVVYGNLAVINVYADADGVYSLDINGNVSTINVVNGSYSVSLPLAVGKYYANVTFDNSNYSTTISNDVFEVYPAVNNVKVIVNNVVYGNLAVINVYADVDGVYTVDVNGTVRDVTVVNHLGNFSLSLDAGRYYANVTFENSNYSSVIANDVFDVYKALNNVKVIVNNVVYGNLAVINVYADVDGVYTVDVNGTVRDVTVVNHLGNFSLSLGAGRYYANVTFDNGNYSSVVTNDVFEVYPAVNNVKVIVNNVVYGDSSVIVVYADVDGVYTVDVNGTVRDVTVVNHLGNFSLSLDAGRYYANVTFENSNYSSVITNDVFDVYKALNNVQIIVYDDMYSPDLILEVVADVDGEYILDFNGNVSSVSVVNGSYSVILSLAPGMYYANVTFDNDNYVNLISNIEFEVYPPVNFVKVSADSVVYGQDVVVNVTADVDGVYNLNINGNVTTINVVGGRYSATLRLAAGKYYANVTFDDNDYENIITNAVFEVYKATNNVKVSANSVTYGNNVVIEVVANADGVYNLDVNGTISTVNVVNGRGSVSLPLAAGRYYVNVTFDNSNYSTNINNAVFEVYKAVNNVRVSVDNVVYGNMSVINVYADVDGIYSLDVNGNRTTINVVNGNYSTSLNLDVGKYYANVTFGDDNYSTTVTNSVFVVYPALNNVNVIIYRDMNSDNFTLEVVADVDGEYTLDFNGNVSTIEVVNGRYSTSLSLAYGKYYANVTFDNNNYINLISNIEFEHNPLVNNVKVVANNVIYGKNVSIVIVADFDGVYTLNINGTIKEVSVVNHLGNFSLSLGAGKYYANVTFDDDHYSTTVTNATFEVYPAVNNVKVNINSVTYGNDVVIEVIADADGVYSLDVNGNVSTINVVNGRYSDSLRLSAGSYYANVTFDNGNYSTVITNAVFEVYKAVNNVRVSVENVVYGKESVIVVYADADGVYTVDVNGTIKEVSVVNHLGNFSLSLGVGKYYANVTFDNSNYSTTIANDVFEVYPTVNNIKVIANSVVYGNNVVLMVVADVDGVYSLDFNGNVSTIEIVNGSYSVPLNLGVGKYYANVTFDDSNYSTVITNAVFEVYKAKNNVKVSASSVAYGNLAVINVYANADGVYSLDVNGTVSTVNLVNGRGSVSVRLAAGKYYANVTFDNGNYSTAVTNAVFEVYPAVNNVKVIVSSVSYGNESLIVVYADVDGVYTVDVNGTIKEVSVVNHLGNFSLSLNVGKYYANVTFDDGNYSTAVTNAVFEVYPAVNNVKVIVNNVAYGDSSVIVVYADVDGVYTVDVNGTVKQVSVVNHLGNFSLSLGVGRYYANVTFDDGNYSSVVTNAVFEVYPAVNNVKVIVRSVSYGNESLIVVYADVDGVYTVDVNGTVKQVSVVNHLGNFSLSLGVGRYYANATFDDGNYSSVVTNAVFEVYPAVNNVKVIVSSVSYGNESLIVVYADVDGVYSLDVSGNVSAINVVNGKGSVSLHLDVGRYYANVTFDDGNYSSVVTNAVFEVYPAVNNVKVIANSVAYGKDVVLMVIADVDGIYSLDFNGNVSTISVVNGSYSTSLSLNVGKYYADVTFDDGNYSSVITNAVFEVYKAKNNVKVSAGSAVYGDLAVIKVYANADGVYNLDVNGTVSTVNVVNGRGSVSVRLAAGKYYANVTFDNGNYSTAVTNAVFEVYPAMNSVKVIVSSVSYGNGSLIVVYADVDGVYTVDVNGTIKEVSVVNHLGNFSLSLGVGRYYANATFDDGNYSTVVTNAVFEVYPTVNNVKVIASSVTYGKETVIIVYADVDGVYTVDVNGTVKQVSVVNHFGNFSLSLGVGRYYANATFDNDNYSSVITNDVFEVYRAINNVQIIVYDDMYSPNLILEVVAEVDGVYSLDVNGNVSSISVVNGSYSTYLSLGVGKYYANVTFDNDNYKNIISNIEFEVYPILNNVKVIANSVIYGNNVVLEVVADVDGNYTLDFNGKLRIINVVGGRYSTTLRLAAGKYYANVTFDDENYENIITNAVFEVYKAKNNVKVRANSVTYGNDVVINIYADADGVYSLDINGDVRTINVVNGSYSVSLPLAAGKYYANVTFNDKNYLTTITNAVFEVYKAVNNVKVIVGSVTYGRDVVINVYADVDGVYTVDVNGTIKEVTVVDHLGNFSLSLDVGKYYANVTFDDGNYSTVITNEVFEVYPAVNNVDVIANDVAYGKDVVIEVIADVDGEYILDINGDVRTISVVNGSYSTSLSLGVGKYYANVTFDNGNYLNVITNDVFEVYPAVNNIRVIANSVIYGNDVVLEVIANADGDYTLDFNGNVTTIKVVNGRYSVSMHLDAGKYYANVTFDNGNYSNTITNAVFEVYKAVNNVKVIVDNVTVGEESVIVVYADADGVYTVDVNGTIRQVSVVNNTSSFALSLGIGKYYANVTALRDDNYVPNITNTVFEVLPVGDYEMIVGAACDDEVYVYVILPDSATGVVTIHVAGKNYSGELNTGIAIIAVPDLSPGDYDIDVYYAGDNQFTSRSSNFTFHVKQILIDAYDAQYGWANSVTYSVKLIDEYGYPVCDKEVQFSINGETFKSITDSNGIAKVSVSLNIGSYDINVTYKSDSVVKNITVVSRFSGNKNINMYYFDGSKYTFKVYGNNGKLVGANQKVLIILNKKTYTIKTNKNGVISFKIPKTLKKLGKYTIIATYKGQTIKNTVKVKQILTSKKTVQVKRTAKKLVLKANLKKKLKGKTIVFKFKGKKYKAKTNKNGFAKVNINKNIIKTLKKGKKYTVMISYYNLSIKTKVMVK